MGRIKFATGTWTTALGLELAGWTVAIGVPSPRHELQLLAYLAILTGILLLVWGVTIDSEHWWKRLSPLKLFRWRRGIYIGQVLVSDTKLDTEGYLDLTIRAYNGTAQTLRYAGVTGFVRIEFSLNGNGAGGFDLLPPAFVSGDSSCPSGSELFANFRLTLTPAQVREFRAQQTSGSTPQLLFGTLKIVVSRRWGKPIRLPLWDGISFANGQASGQVHGQIAIAVGTTVVSSKGL